MSFHALLLDDVELPVLRDMVEAIAKSRAHNGGSLTSVERQVRDQIATLAIAAATSVRPEPTAAAEMIDTVEAGRRLGISRHAVADLCRRGVFTWHRTGRRYLIAAGDVAAYVPRSER